MAQYTLELTQQAKAVYCAFWQKANGSPNEGDAAALEEMESLFDRISHEPANDQWRLSGVFSYLFRVRGKWSRMKYRIYSTLFRVVIISITPEIIGSPDPKEVLAACAEILTPEPTSENRKLRNLLGLPEPPSGVRPGQVH